MKSARAPGVPSLKSRPNAPRRSGDEFMSTSPLSLTTKPLPVFSVSISTFMPQPPLSGYRFLEDQHGPLFLVRVVFHPVEDRAHEMGAEAARPDVVQLAGGDRRNVHPLSEVPEPERDPSVIGAHGERDQVPFPGHLVPRLPVRHDVLPKQTSVRSSCCGASAVNLITPSMIADFCSSGSGPVFRITASNRSYP